MPNWFQKINSREHLLLGFIGFYILIVFGCILFRVESWPFSDWRVFAQSLSMKELQIYELNLNDGLNTMRIDKDSSKHIIKRVLFHHKVVHSADDGNFEAISQLVKSIFSTTRAQAWVSKKNIQTVSLVRTRVSADFDEELFTPYRWTFRYETLIKWQIKNGGLIRKLQSDK